MCHWSTKYRSRSPGQCNLLGQYIKEKHYASLHEIFSTDAGQLSDRLKFLAGQNKILQDRRLSVIKLLSLFARNHRTFVRQTEIFCRTY